MYMSLHNHTAASNIRFLDSINKPEEMINRAIELGYNGLAFTDHESLSAAISILKIRDKIKMTNPDFKIIFGNEIYLIDDQSVHNTRKYFHFILLAKDKIGWDQLRALSSRAWERGYVDRGILRVPTTYSDIEEVIKTNPGHVFASTACIGGELANHILEHNVAQANSFIRWCIDCFGHENFSLELQPSDNPDQILVNKTLIKLSRFYTIPYIITTDSHYLKKEDFKIHSIFLNSKQAADRETDKFYRFTYMMSEDEICDILSAGGLTSEEIQEGLLNSYNVGSQCQEYDFRHGTIVPKIKIPHFTLDYSLMSQETEYPFIKQYYESADPQDTYLMYQMEQGIKNKQIVLDSTKLERINTELDVLHHISVNLNQNLSAYLNLTTNIVDIAWQVSLVGCGRGSACGFYINYLIGITQADPLKYDLPYWRFLNKERVELPDVDEDFQPEKTEEIIQLLRQEYGDDNVLNCATFKTESLKSSILTCGRGLGYNNDDMQALAALVPNHRGHNYTLKECLVGDEDQGFEPVPNFEDKLKCYPGLFEAVQKIEGLPTNASIHASALYVFNNGYLAQNSLMRAPNKTKMTAFNMHDSDDMGALKMDVLRTDAQSKMAKCLELLLKDKQIEWQGDLRSTYNKYLHPDVLDYDNNRMWERAASGEIANLFQFETPVGSVCIKKAKPTNVIQLAEINSIMRLQVEGSEQPIDRYVRFRENIDAWYLEMYENGLCPNEISILEKYLLNSNGVSGSQEVLMRILMDEHVCHFTLGEANLARKAIAKKQAKKLIQLKKDFYDKGQQANARKAFLDYVWKYCIEPQLGYSFSLNHTLPYSIIAVQEMNLATRWNPLYWQCACLCVNAGNYVGDLSEDNTSEECNDYNDAENEGESDSSVVERHVAPNYGKIAKAIADAQLAGATIELPDINESQVDFVPDIKNNSILYSLQAVNVVNDTLLSNILNNRPYSSMEDFLQKVPVTQAQMIGLIKAGCFDNLEKQPRPIIMDRYLQMLADQEFPLKEKITSVQIKKALKLGFHNESLATVIRIFKYKFYLDAKQTSEDKKRYILSDEVCLKFFNTYIMPKLSLSKGDYEFLPDNNIGIKISVFKKYYMKAIEPLVTYFNSPDGLKEYQKLLQQDFISTLKEKYCQGSVSKWEMDTMSFYQQKHELSAMQNTLYNTKNFNELPEYPEDPRDLCTIAGTVTDFNNNRHTISLLTNYGIVDVKFYASLYTQYSKKISVMDENTKKKTVIDDSWFKRGNKLIVHGQRRENMFCCKGDRGPQNRAPRFIGVIEKIYNDGSLDIRYHRNTKV